MEEENKMLHIYSCMDNLDATDIHYDKKFQIYRDD